MELIKTKTNMKLILIDFAFVYAKCWKKLLWFKKRVNKNDIIYTYM